MQINCAVTLFTGFGGYWLVLVDMLMAFCMAVASNLPAFLYGSSEVMAMSVAKPTSFIGGVQWVCNY